MLWALVSNLNIIRDLKDIFETTQEYQEKDFEHPVVLT